MRKIAIIGAGASGYFTAIQLMERAVIAELKLYEKSTPLAKVKVSGGGRCNVTHACFEPEELSSYYPRGAKELRGPFHQFQPGDMMEWLQSRGVALKIEDDGRIFPVSDRSQSIIDCFESMLPPAILKKKGVKDIHHGAEGKWILVEEDGNTAEFDVVVIATGSSEQMWKVLERLEIPMTPRVPSLFTFNIGDDRLHSLAGLALPINCRLVDSSFETQGPMLITHWGMSGPAILKMSAYAALELAQKKYQFKIAIHSLPLLSDSAIEELLIQAKKNAPRKQIRNYVPFQFPVRWWQYLLGEGDWSLKNWADMSKSEMQFCMQVLVNKELEVNGKSIFKEEFVTAGGVDLKSVNFKTMESKTHPGIYFVGEVLNIDGVTGGFNFQSCWTTAFLAAQAIGYAP